MVKTIMKKSKKSVRRADFERFSFICTNNDVCVTPMCNDGLGTTSLYTGDLKSPKKVLFSQRV